MILQWWSLRRVLPTDRRKRRRAIGRRLQNINVLRVCRVVTLICGTQNMPVVFKRRYSCMSGQVGLNVIFLFLFVNLTMTTDEAVWQ